MRLGRAGMSFIVAGGVCVAAIGAGAADREQAGLVLASGRLTDHAGHPQSGLVRAYAWPIDRRHTRSLPLAASASADGSGRFTLRARNARQLANLSRAKGSVDLLVVGSARSGLGDTVFSSRVAARSGALAATAASGETHTPAITVATRASSGAEARVASPSCKDYSDVGAPKTRPVKSYKRPVTIGELNNVYPDTRATFTYGTRADTEVSAGFSYNGNNWSLEGSTHIGNKKSRALHITRRGAYARRLRTNFIFTKYKISLCPAPHAGSHYYRVRAEEWSGGLSGRDQSGTLNVCYGGFSSNDYPRDSGFSRADERAVVWRRGVQVAGAGLSTRSGFSRYVRIAYEFGHGVGRHRLCGSDGRSEGTAGRVFSGVGHVRAGQARP